MYAGPKRGQRIRSVCHRVFAQGGFDVVVGNPPYIRQEWLAPFKPYWEKRYRSYHGVADIFVYFFEQRHRAPATRRPVGLHHLRQLGEAGKHASLQQQGSR
jgi:hypothetical protein